MERRTTFKLAAAGLAAPALAGPALLAGDAQAQSARDGVLRLANAVELNTLDPHAVLDTGRLNFKVNVYDSLYRFAGNPPVMQPWLAERHEVSADGIRVRVHLRRGVVFHDGSPFTAADVVYSMERMLALQQGPTRLFAGLVAPGGTRALDDHTVEFTLTRPAAPFPSLLSEFYVVNSRLVRANERDGDWGRAWLAGNVAASGSWRVTAYDPAVGWEGERFDGHFLPWHERAPTGIRFRTIREANSQTLGMQRGDIDYFIGTLSADQVERMARARSVVALREPSTRLFMMLFNTRRPPFDDVHVRRAISMAFDYEGWINGIMNGTATRSTGPIPPGLPGALPAPVFNYDLDAARAELARAAVRVDRPVSLHCMTGIARTEQAAQVMQAGLRQLGIEARIVAETWPTLANRCRTEETTPDMMTIWSGAEYMDPHNWIGDHYHSAQHGNWKACSWWSGPETDEMITRAYQSQDEAERIRLYGDVARRAAESAASVYIHNEDWLGVRNTRVQGFEFTPVGNGNHIRSMWLQNS